MSRGPLLPGRSAEEQSLLAAAIDDEDDDTPRLVYADWLEENGDPERAEFIRTQVELARLSDDFGRREALERRQVELLQEHWTAWAEPLFALRALAWEFRRGLLDEVTLSAEDFLRGAGALFRQTTARHLRLVESAGALGVLARSPLLDHVRRLDLSGIDEGDQNLVNEPGDVTARTLAGSPHLGGLRGLRIAAADMSEEGCRALAAARHLGGLIELDLSGNPIGDAGAAALVGTQPLAGVRRFGLQDSQLGPGAAQALAHSPFVGRLHTLLLDGNSLGDEGLTALAASPGLTGLIALSLGNDPAGDEGARALAASPLLGRLSAVALGERVGEAGLSAILSSPHLRGVTALQFGDAYDFQYRVFPPGNVLLPPKHVPAPGQFTLGHSNRELAQAEVLLRADVPPGLTCLTLRFRWRPGARFVGLAGWPPFANLTDLDLGRSEFGERGGAELFACPTLRNLRRLDLRGRGVTAAEAAALAEPSHLPALEEVRLDGDGLGPQELRVLAASPRAAAFRCDFPALLRREQWPEPWGRLLYGERLEHLSIFTEGGIGDAELVKLAETPLLRGLLSVNVGQTKATLEGVQALVSSPHVAGLRLLRLSFLPVGDEGARVVAASPHMSALTTLKLSFCAIGDEGAKALAASPHLTRLTTLKLWGYGERRIGDAGAAALANSSTLANLVALRLADNAIGDAGAEALANSPYLRRMLYLYIWGNPIGPRGWEALRRRFGGRVRGFAGEPLPDGL